jgi:acetyl-CoA carboxylase carboxyltransferase component
MSLALVEDTGTEVLSPVERLETLCDPGTLTIMRSGVRSNRIGAKAVDGDGVVTGTGRVNGRPVYCYAQDASFLGGSLGEAHADSIVRVMRLAGRAGAPVVGFIDSGGARLQEGVGALSGYARIFRENVRLSGKVPQISVICGPSAGGGSYSPALTDFVVMTKRARMFLTGPGIVREVMGEDVDAEALGGPKVHDRNGVAHFSADDDAGAARLARELLTFVDGGSVIPKPAPGIPDVPTEQRRAYDVRDVIRGIADDGRLLEWSSRWARNMACGFIRLEGRTVGVVANQPRYLGGVLDADSATKGARFVRTCDAFGIPLVVLVDTPGFLPGTKQEQGGVIRHGAKLVHAFAAATVPRVTVVLRKAFGGAFIAMNARDLGADYVFAWPNAQIGVMGAPQAVSLLHRRVLATEPERKDALADAYADEHLSAEGAAAEGHIDELVAPIETRDRLADALATLDGATVPAAIPNMPL